MKKGMKTGIVLLLVAVAVVAAFRLLRKDSKPKTAYNSATVRRGTLVHSVTATGTIEPIIQVEVGTQVSGIIDRIYVDYNSIVKKGEVIAEIDRSTLEAELESSTATLESNKTEYEYQEKNFARIKGLHDKGMVSDTDFETAEYNYNKAKSAYDKSKADMFKVRQNLGYATITAPIDGVVIGREVEEGQTVAASFETPTLFTIANDLSQMRVIADVDEADIGSVQDGQRATFTVDAYPDDVFEGTVTQVRLQATTESNESRPETEAGSDSQHHDLHAPERRRAARSFESPPFHTRRRDRGDVRLFEPPLQNPVGRNGQRNRAGRRDDRRNGRHLYRSDRPDQGGGPGRHVGKFGNSGSGRRYERPVESVHAVASRTKEEVASRAGLPRKAALFRPAENAGNRVPLFSGTIIQTEPVSTSDFGTHEQRRRATAQLHRRSCRRTHESFRTTKPNQRKTMDNHIIRVENLRRDFQVGGETVHALRGVTFSVAKGEFVTIMGTSGSGKSTLLNILGCLDTPTSGEYWLDGVSVREMGRNDRATLRNRKIGFVFQSYNLLPKTTALENVELPLFYNPDVSARERRERATEALKEVGLSDRIHHRSNQMSGGQQQRVAIARALVNNPVMILADEATGNLDTRTSFEILTLFQRLHAEGSTIVFVTHNPEIAQFSSRNIVLRDGHITDDVRNGNIQSAQAVLDTIPVDNGM